MADRLSPTHFILDQEVITPKGKGLYIGLASQDKLLVRIPIANLEEETRNALKRLHRTCLVIAFRENEVIPVVDVPVKQKCPSEGGARDISRRRIKQKPDPSQ